MTEPEQTTLEPSTQTFAYLPTSTIDDPERPMRSNMAEEDVQDLVASIKMVGLLEPIVVVARGDRYEVVAGHRRITACELAGLQEVPCHIVSGSQDQVEMMKIHENLVRKDVNPWDEASHYDRLIREMKLTPGKIARLTNRGETYVRDRLKILAMDDRLQTAVRDGQLKLAVALELARIDDPAKLGEMMGYATGHGITAAVARKWVDENKPQEAPTPGVYTPPDDGQPVTPASEQGTECFYCLEQVRLWDATNVYVHDKCAAQRRTEAETPAPQG